MGMKDQLALFAIVITVAACSSSGPSIIEAATGCIRKQVPEGADVSELMARSVLTDCQPLLNKWSEESVEHSFGRPLDRSDLEMMDAFKNHQEATHDFWMKRLSEKYAAAHVDYD
ncbi:hypothetical protein CA833_05270 [Novosphingobium sp. KA1]|nr:hypothetical protein CA833_05270 [Novosphingobium sp. KA1]